MSKVPNPFPEPEQTYPKQTSKKISLLKLFCSCLRVLKQIYGLQGLPGVVRVVPIIWTIILTVKSFSGYYKKVRAQQLILPADLQQSENASDLTNLELAEYRQLGQWLRKKLHRLGPTFIKIGQTLSTRADIVPLPVLVELALLQEDLEPFPTEIAIDIIKRELGHDPSQLFATFNFKPVAAASLSQAYRACLADGRDVVVKVQRPQLSLIIAKDIQILQAVAQEIMQYPSLSRHTNWPGVIQEFARTVFEEIDYLKEGRNADTFRHNFRDNNRIYIPRIIWRLTGRRVLTIEYVPGMKVTDSHALEASGLDRQEITKIGTNFYLRQLLEDGFFHADPHPGNMRIMPDGRIGIFDFGMVGRLSASLKQNLINAFLHVIKKEYYSLVEDFIAMGFLDPGADKEALCQELVPIIEVRFAQGLSQVQFRKLVFDFSDIVYRYPFCLPSEFTYVMRALLTLEGVALTINPDFNFIDAALPYAQQLLWKREGSSLRHTILKEVFSEGRFNPNAAINLFKTAARLSFETRI